MKAASFVLPLSVLALIASGSCVNRQRIPATSSLPAAQALPTGETGPFVVIGHLEHRDRIVTIKSGDQGTVYSVTSKDGKLLFENLTAAQLKEQSPEIHSFIEAATAGFASVVPERRILGSR